MAERSLRAVPRPILALLAATLALQLAWGTVRPAPLADASSLGAVPSRDTIMATSLGETIPASEWLALYLQVFDNQPGISLPFADLDYEIVTDWLDRMLELDPQAQYPLLMATHLYAQVPDESKQRQMLEFTYRKFFAAPDQRWQWLAHAAILAKHRLHDLPLALRYAQAIARHATGQGVPHWAQQMPIFILEDMGQGESARILLGGLLANHSITDPQEIYFLTERLNELEPRDVENPSPPSKSRQKPD